MSKFFIDRPVFAWVVALFVIFGGFLSLSKLPVEQYPNISAPTITLNTVYPGASAEMHEQAVLSIIEREMNGIDGLDYIKSQADANGSGSISLTFRTGTNEDIAQVNVQNRLSQAEPRLPASVRQNGITVSKANTGYLMIVSLSATEESGITLRELNDYAVRNIVPELQRIDGVGAVTQFGTETSMRIWLNPEQMRGYEVNANDVADAIASQNLQIASGGIGALPAVEGQQISATINVDGQLSTPEQFGAIIIKHKRDGSTVRLSDIARIELGESAYSTLARINGKEATALGVQLSTTGNAVATSDAVQQRMSQLEKYFPAGMEWLVPYDTSTFVKISIQKVLVTLGEAVALVFIVMFLFLQNIRYTLIPTIVVPISLFGAIAIMYPLGMSINVLTMFAMVLVIGIVVDDAIVVVENVERLMAEEGLTPYQATVKSMGQISTAIFGITIVNIVVFLPMAFFSGSTGGIFRQFSLVMASSIAFSGFFAITLTPALCATMLKPVSADHHEKGGFFGWFNRFVKACARGYENSLARFLRISYFMFIVYLGLVVGTAWLFVRIPTSFLPTEDQGYFITNIQLPAGASAERTDALLAEIEGMVREVPEVKNIVAVRGFSFAGAGQNMGLAFVTLKDWSERTAPTQSVTAVTGGLMGRFIGQLRDATVFAVTPPAILSLGNATGFSFALQDRQGQGREALLNARNMMLGMLMQNKNLTSVRPSGLEDAPQLRININRDKAYSQNVSMASIANVLRMTLGSAYINDFPNNGRLQRVTMQSDANARMQESDVMNLTVPNGLGGQTPLNTIATSSWEFGAMQTLRYNGYPAKEISGEGANGLSSGEAMNIVEQMAEKLPSGFAIQWTGLSLEEQRSGDQELYIYLATALVVFLCLAALYESWSIPFAVLLVLPLGVLGVASGVFGRNLFNAKILEALIEAGKVNPMAKPEQFANDIYFKVGMITVMGLVAKNAILIIEFAKEQQEAGIGRLQAALTAAHLRFRPILMTSFAFILGVVPLYIASGASSASQRAIGTSVFWGMLIGTLLGLLFIPIFFVLVRKIFPMRLHRDKYAIQGGQA